MAYIMCTCWAVASQRVHNSPNDPIFPDLMLVHVSDGGFKEAFERCFWRGNDVRIPECR